MTISNAARRLADRLHDLAHAGGHEDDVIEPLSDFIDERIAANASTSPSLDAFVAAAKRGAEPVVDVPRRNAVPLPAKPSLTQIAEDIYECAISHDPAVRLIGNVRADQVAAVASRFLDGQLKQAAVDAGERRIADLEAKAVVLAQAASAFSDSACSPIRSAEKSGADVSQTWALQVALENALEAFADLIARTEGAP